MNEFLFQALLAVGVVVLPVAGVALVVFMARLTCESMIDLRAALRDLKTQHRNYRGIDR